MLSSVEVAQEMVLLSVLPEKAIGAALGLMNGMRLITMLAGPPLGTWLYEFGCWSLSFGASGLLLACASALLLVTRGREADAALKPKSPVSTWELLRVPNLWMLLLLCLLPAYVEGALVPLYEPFLTNAPFGLSIQEVGTFVLVSSLVQAISLVICGPLVVFLGWAPLLLFGSLLICVGMLITGPITLLQHVMPTTFGLTVGGQMSTAVGSGFMAPPGAILCLHVYKTAGYTQKQVAGVSSSMFVATYAIGSALGSPTGGMLYDTFGGFAGATEVCFFLQALLSMLIGYLIFKYGNMRPGADTQPGSPLLASGAPVTRFPPKFDAEPCLEVRPSASA